MRSIQSCELEPIAAPEEWRVANRDTFVAAMAGAVTGVTVLTTDGPAGRFGITVSATASASADPPMMLACVNRRSPAAAAIEKNDAFCVNLLTEAQAHVADVFAGRVRGGVPFSFDCAEWRKGVTGSPLLVGAVANFDCRVVSCQEAGSHLVFVGRVMSVCSTDSRALAHSQRAYCSISALTA